MAVLNPWLGTRAGDSASADRPPPPLRGGLYGDFAWRGWHLLHRLRTHQSVVTILARARDVVGGANRTIEHCADELHDGSEEVLGQLVVGAHQLRRRITAALLAAAYTLRSLSVTSDEHD